MLNECGESEHSFFITDFRGDGFGFSPLSMMLVISLSYIVFIVLWNVPSIPNVFRIFILKGC
jgi:hypothetical protein